MNLCHFVAQVKDVVKNSELQLISRGGLYFVTMAFQGEVRCLLNGSQSLLTALSIIQTIASDPFSEFTIIKQLDVQLPRNSKERSFKRPDWLDCIVIGVHQNSYQLAIAEDGAYELSKATQLDGKYSTTLSGIKLFDAVKADPLTRTIKFC
ncbi:hypothetical protein H5202_07680 [Shewanella sp. SG41-4]|jgi:hypothetical protein|uniref:hypothetical protein n=1 Tax=Shewanella sp. SG41-4 TaxID=2760976 RepID=UPI0016047A9B|nr:hypothetical protein [Shewanella sp. SG41-4]MBB1438571.1 hypothetical protein [Shewanella sp. SG41-4]